MKDFKKVVFVINILFSFSLLKATEFKKDLREEEKEENQIVMERVAAQKYDELFTSNRLPERKLDEFFYAKQARREANYILDERLKTAKKINLSSSLMPYIIFLMQKSIIIMMLYTK